ncbi:MAG: hypothetical protein KatS3mg068_2530 [Candidatus Sericytochromatia bacterium]|nr:MAG: hypothetical protein KatS3mg068_2530 [Candidatus Sericytochromatia bacterium]
MNNRINKDLILENRNIFIYGNIYELFCDNDLIIKNLDYFIKDIFKKNYQKIIFFDINNLDYSLEDNKDYNFENKVSKILGPLGNINLIESKTNTYEKSFINSILFIDKIIQENNSICIVFKDLYYLSTNFIEESSFRFLKNKLLEWLKIFKDIKFIFTFDLNSFEDIYKIIEENKLLFLKNYINVNNTTKIDYPNEKEIFYLLNNLRLTKNINVDWKIFRKIPELLENEKILLKDIYYKFNKLKNLNKNVLKKLFNDRFLKNTSIQLIENIEKEFSFNLFKEFDKLKGQRLVKENIINLLDIWYKGEDKTISFLLIGNSFVGKTLTIEILLDIMKNFSYKGVIINNFNYKNITINDKSIIIFENVENISSDVWNNFSFLFREENKNIILLTSNRKISLNGNFMSFENQAKIRNIFIEINKEIFSNVDYFIVYKNISYKIKYKIIENELKKIVSKYNLNLKKINKDFINKYLQENITSVNIKDIKNNIKYNLSRIILDLKRQNPNIKDIFI